MTRLFLCIVDENEKMSLRLFSLFFVVLVWISSAAVVGIWVALVIDATRDVLKWLE